jgi:hypothetical protein
MMKPVFRDSTYWIPKDVARRQLGVTDLALSRLRLRTIRVRVDGRPVTLVNAADVRRAVKKIRGNHNYQWSVPLREPEEEINPATRSLHLELAGVTGESRRCNVARSLRAYDQLCVPVASYLRGLNHAPKNSGNESVVFVWPGFLGWAVLCPCANASH